MARACSVCLSNCLRLHGSQTEREDVAAACSGEKERNPSFLKKMAKSTMSSLKLPLSFVRGQIDRLDGSSVILEGPSMGRWRVELQGSFQSFSLNFGQGWEKFVADHVLQVDDLLTFSLSAKSYFQVEVYDGGGCLKTSALDAEVAETEVTEPVVNAVQTARSAATMPVVETVAEPARSAANVAEPARSAAEVAEPARSVSEIGERSEGLYDPDSEDDLELVKASEQELLPELQVVRGRVLSRRPPVTALEKERALQAAKSLELANPSVVIVMRKQNVYKGFWLGIPKQFAKEWMPSGNIEVKIFNKGGYSWAVKWIAVRSGLSSGWRRFSLDHRLEAHDVCVLEMVDAENHVLLAHIFRVLSSPEEDLGLYPHTISPDKKTKRKSLNSPEADGEGSQRKSSRRAGLEPELGMEKSGNGVMTSPGDNIGGSDGGEQDDAEATPTAPLEHKISALPGDDDMSSPEDPPTSACRAEETSASEGVLTPSSCPQEVGCAQEVLAPSSCPQEVGCAQEVLAPINCGQEADENTGSEQQPRKQQGKRGDSDPDSVTTTSLKRKRRLLEASPAKGKEPETAAGPSDPEFSDAGHVVNAPVLALICYQNGVSDAYVNPDDVHEQIMHVPEIPRRKQAVHVRRRKETRQEYKVVHIYGGRNFSNGTEFLTELEGYSEDDSAAYLDRDDDTGFWWVPYQQFGWDMMRCYVG